MKNSYGIIILAAGSSTRFGKPKQLLAYKNKTLLQHVTDEAKNSLADIIILVMGANAETIKKETATKNISVVINEQWKKGMASSIGCGIKELQKINPAIDAAIIMVCDQPFVTRELLDKLITVHNETKKQIVTCSYDNTTGPPVLFHQLLFPELIQLKGDSGARKIVQEYAKEVVTVFFPEGVVDIDTAEDYEKLQQ